MRINIDTVKDIADEPVLLEADVIHINNITRKAIVKLRSGLNAMSVDLGDIDPSILSSPNAKLLVHVGAFGSIRAVTPIPRSGLAASSPGVTLGDIQGGSKWKVFNSANDVVASIDSEGLLTLYGGMQTYAAYGTYSYLSSAMWQHDGDMTIDAKGAVLRFLDIINSDGNGINVRIDGDVRIGSLNAPTETLEVDGNIYADEGSYFIKDATSGTKERVIHTTSSGQHLYLGDNWSGDGTDGVIHIGFDMDATNRYIGLGYGATITEVKVGGKFTVESVNGIEIDVASGDPIIIFDTDGADKFTIGVDDDDGDKFKINSGGSLADPSDFELDSNGNMEIGGDFNLLTGKGVIHADGVTDGYVLRADGTRYVPAQLDISDISGGNGGGGGAGVDIGARVYNSGDINIDNITWTALTFDSERYDTDTIHSVITNTGRLTATTAGKYHISGHVRFAGDSVGTRLIDIYLNGTAIIATVRQNPTAASAADYMAIDTIWNMSADDYVELRVYQSSGGALDVQAVADYSPEFMMQMLEGAGPSNIGTRVYNSGDISIDHDTLTALTFDSERWDTDAFHSTVTNTDRLTVPAGLGGTYLIVGHIRWDTNAVGARSLYLNLNGTTLIALQQSEPVEVSSPTSQFVTTIYNLSATDYVTLSVYQNSGGALDVRGQANFSPEFMMHLIESVGGGVAHPDIGARVYNSGAIEIPHNTSTSLTFDSERWDTDTIHSTVTNTNRLTAVTPGTYLIEGNISYDYDALGVRDAQIRLNGSTLIALDRRDACSGSSPTICTVSTTYYLSATDYVELRAFQNSGDPLDVGVASNYSPEFSMQLLAQ